MKPTLTIIDQQQGIDELKQYLSDKEYVAFDIETTGLTRDSIVIGYSICAEEGRAFYVILHKYENGTLTAVPYADHISILTSLKDKKLICHNGIFDCHMIESNFKISLIESLHTDTMILAHLLDENRRVGLKELAQEYFGDTATEEQKLMKESIVQNGGKVTRDAYELYKADPQLIARYGAQDALLTYKLFLELVPELYDQGLDQFFYEEESMPLLKGPTYHLNTTGLKVDQDRLMTLRKTLEAECEEAKTYIYKEIQPYIKDKYPGTNKKNTFNIGASQQLSWLLFDKLELEFQTLTDAGKDVCKSMGIKIPYHFKAKREFLAQIKYAKDLVYQSEATVNGKKVRAKKIKDSWAYIKCNKTVLTKLAPKFKWIQILLEYQRKTKLLNTYVEGIHERLQYGIIRPSFLQHGTTSGRYASRNPNFQNLPRDDKRVKNTVVSRPGKSFVGADYSQLEPRVFAYLSGDERLLQAFDGTNDFYSVIGMEVYQKSDCTPQKDGSPDAFGVKYKSLRNLSKVIALASTYGATAQQLSPTTGKSIEDTQQDIDNYFETFPSVKKFMTDSHGIAKKNGYVENIFGRKRRMPEAKKIAKIYGDKEHADLPYEARNILNLAVNHRVQSTGASIVNRAAIKFLEHCSIAGIEVRLVLQVHDSLIAECRDEDAESVALLMQDAMENTVELQGVKLEAHPIIGKSLAEV